MPKTDGKAATVVFGGGCFWCTEAVFLQFEGVRSVVSGYAGGSMEDPDYEAVSSGRTGHAEVIRIEYDPDVISFGNLLEVFFASHDPATPNRQGADMGSQYRSVIFYTNDVQKREALRYIFDLNRAKAHSRPIVTEVKKLDVFYPAEAYHQNFYKNNPGTSYAEAVIKPKVEKIKKEFEEMLHRA